MRMSRGWWQRNAGRFLWFLDSSNSRLHSVGDPATKKCPVPHKLGCHFFGNAESRISQGLQRRWGESRNVKEKLWDLSRENVYFASNYWCDYFAASESCVCVKKFHLFHGFLSPKFFSWKCGNLAKIWEFVLSGRWQPIMKCQKLMDLAWPIVCTLVYSLPQ